MSYDISLICPSCREALHADQKHELRGGTYALGGTSELSLNVTYNYGRHFYRTLGEKGIRTIYGMTGKDSIPLLEDAANQLGTDTSEDYWEATEGNARSALKNLIALAQMRPDGIWDGD